jgi:hypothetical protein
MAPLYQRVLFTGPTGVKKKHVLAMVVREYFKENLPSVLVPENDEELWNDPNVKRYIQFFSLEEEIKRSKNLEIPTWLEREEERLEEDWKEAFSEVLKKLRKLPKNIIAFIELHTHYFRGQKRPFLIDLREILKLKPNLIITLINDVYSIYYEVKKRELSKPTGSYLRLSDILDWRDREISFSDSLARTLKIKNYVVSVKHPTKMLYRLIFERDKRCICYLSFPITETRKTKEGIEEINEHRYRLHQTEHIVFDPLTIDERAIQFAFQSKFGNEAVEDPSKISEKSIKLERIHRWPIQDQEYSPMVPDPPDLFPLDLPSYEVYSVVYRPLEEEKEMGKKKFWRCQIDSQIEERDKHIIDRVDYFIAYRPYWKGKESKGVLSELAYARGRVPCIVYHPEEDDALLKMRGISPFEKTEGLIVFSEKDKFYKYIENLRCVKKPNS